MSQQPLPQVLVLAMGGTIAGRSSSRVESRDYDLGMVTGAELIAQIPESAEYAQVQVVDVSDLSSHQHTPATWLDLTKRVDTAIAQNEADAIVITHGTDTLEDTAFFLAATTRSDAPIVVTGSMRPGTSLSSDGDMNLLQSIAVAASSSARGRGVLAVMADRICSGAYVQKMSGTTVQAFGTPAQGFVGGFIGVDPHFYFGPSRPTTPNHFDVRQVDTLPDIAIVSMYPGADTALLDAAVTTSDGVVLDCPGTGWPPDPVHDRIRELVADGYPITITGSAGISFRDDGMDIYAGLRTPRQARIEIMLRLATGG